MVTQQVLHMVNIKPRKLRSWKIWNEIFLKVLIMRRKLLCLFKYLSFSKTKEQVSFFLHINSYKIVFCLIKDDIIKTDIIIHHLEARELRLREIQIICLQPPGQD